MARNRNRRDLGDGCETSDNQAKQTQAFSNGTAIEVKTNYAGLGWLGTLLFVPCVFFSWRSPTGGPIVSAGFFIFSLVGIYLIISGATLRVDEQKIEAFSAFGLNRIFWSEITRVKTDYKNNYIVFESRNSERKIIKALCFTGTAYWKNNNKIEMLNLLREQCARRGISFEKCGDPWGGVSKNVRVRS